MLLIALAFLSLSAWIYLLVFHGGFGGGFWRSAPHLEIEPEPAAWPTVAAVIPARNEAETIGRVVHAHLASDYPGAFRIVVIDDHSEDGTAEIARAAGGRRPVDIVVAPPLPAGWTGKLWAMNAGVDAVRALGASDYILFTDADILTEPSMLRRLVAKAENERLALASLMATLDSRGGWASLLAPAFVYFFQKLYPFASSNRLDRRTAAAAGGVMLVNMRALDNAGGLDTIRTRLIDDCALAARLKLAGAAAPRPIWIGHSSGEATSLRDNRRLSSFWDMVARTAFAQLGHSWLLLLVVVAGMALVYIAPPAIALAYPWHGDAVASTLALAAWAAMAATYIPTLLLYRQSRMSAGLLPFAALIFAAMTVASAVRHLQGTGGRWKGRSYPQG